MSIQIDTAFVQQYRANVDLLLQQKGSKLEGLCRIETGNAEYEYFDRIGATEANEVIGRHTDTPLNNTPHDRRRVGLRDFDWADLIDRKDKLRLLLDPTSAYTRNAAYALGRKKDDVIIEAAFGVAHIGKTGSQTVTFPASQQIAVDYVEKNSPTNSGLTIAKLRAANQLFQENEVDDDEEKFIIVTAQQLNELLQTTEVTSADYNTVRALVDGKINHFMGFNFVRSQRLLTDSNGYRRVIAMTRGAILLYKGEELYVDIGPRRDKRNSTQVYVSGSWDAVRMEEERVVEIKCDENPS